MIHPLIIGLVIGLLIGAIITHKIHAPPKTEFKVNYNITKEVQDDD